MQSMFHSDFVQCMQNQYLWISIINQSGIWKLIFVQLDWKLRVTIKLLFHVDTTLSYWGNCVYFDILQWPFRQHYWQNPFKWLEFWLFWCYVAGFSFCAFQHEMFCIYQKIPPLLENFVYPKKVGIFILPVPMILFFYLTINSVEVYGFWFWPYYGILHIYISGLCLSPCCQGSHLKYALFILIDKHRHKSHIWIKKTTVYSGVLQFNERCLNRALKSIFAWSSYRLLCCIWDKSKPLHILFIVFYI